MDRRIKKTKDAIRFAYFQLLKEKPDGRITIAELTRLANIDRKTFYLHYGCLEDIIDDFCDEKVQELLRRLDENGFLENPIQVQVLFGVLNSLLDENRDSFLLLSLINYHSFWEKIHTIMVSALINAYSDRVKVSKEVMKIYCDFFISGMIRLYRDYLTKPMEVTPEAMEHIIFDIAMNGIKNLTGEP